MAKSLNELWLSSLIYEQMAMLEQTTWTRNRLVGVMNRAEKALVQELIDAMSTSKGPVWNRLNRISSRINKIRSGMWTDLTPKLEEGVVAIGRLDTKSVDSVLQDLLPVKARTTIPTEYFLNSVVRSRPFQGRLLKDWASKLQSDELARLRTTIQSGLIGGLSTAEIVNRIVGTKALQGKDGVLQTSRTQLTTVVDMAVHHILGNARQKYAETNSHLFDGERFTAVLDAATTAVCRSLDGNVYPIGVGPMTPLHWGCRSMRVPVISTESLQSLPLKRSVGQELLAEFTKARGYKAKYRGDLPLAQRQEFDKWLPKRIDQMIGQSTPPQTYTQWLKEQPVSVQEQAMGIAKAALFRKGGLSLDKFVARDGRELTLAELVKRHRKAFIEAGIDPARFEG